MKTKTWSVYGSDAGRLFIEASHNCGLPFLRLCVVSGGQPPAAAWIGFSPDELSELRTAIDNAITAMGVK